MRCGREQRSPYESLALESRRILIVPGLSSTSCSVQSPCLVVDSPLDFRASAFPKIVMTRAPGRTQEVLLLKQEIRSPELAVSSVSFTALLVLSNILLLLLQLRRRFSPREKNNELLTRTSELAMLLGTDHQIKQKAKWEELLIGNCCPIDAEIIPLVI